MSASRRVVVTGMGSVSAGGIGGTAVVAQILADAASPIRPVRAFETAGWASRLGAEVDDAALEGLLDPAAARRLSRICRLTVVACRLAVEDSGVPRGPALGLVVGTEHGDFRSSEEFVTGYLKRGPSGLSPMIFPNTVMNSMAAVAAIEIGARGPSVTVNQATVAGDLAVARAAALVRDGRALAVVAGGVDEMLAHVYRRLSEMGMLSPAAGRGAEGCRPYEPDHNGVVLGEGATFLVLEDLESARARGAVIHAEIRSAAWGNLCVAPHTAPRRRRDPHSPALRPWSRRPSRRRPSGRAMARAMVILLSTTGSSAFSPPIAFPLPCRWPLASASTAGSARSGSPPRPSTARGRRPPPRLGSSWFMASRAAAAAPRS